MCSLLKFLQTAFEKVYAGRKFQEIQIYRFDNIWHAKSINKNRRKQFFTGGRQEEFV